MHKSKHDRDAKNRKKGKRKMRENFPHVVAKMSREMRGKYRLIALEATSHIVEKYSENQKILSFLKKLVNTLRSRVGVL